MIERQKRIDRIRSVEREYLAASDALALLESKLGADPGWGNTPGWKNRVLYP